MKLRIVSDLHFEFHADLGEILAAEVTSTSEQDFDVLVVAGDLATCRILPDAVSKIVRETKKSVVYVPGNHEFYGSNREAVMHVLDGLEQLHPNLHVLDHEIFELDGVRFVGTPLWFKKTKAPWWEMNDFTSIRDFDKWVYSENGRARNFLEKTVREGDVVVTHYLPASESIHPEYEGSRLNPFFLCDMEPLIRRAKPRLWIHGHTHKSRDYTLGETRVVCNPFGYVRFEQNPEFRSSFTIEVP